VGDMRLFDSCLLCGRRHDSTPSPNVLRDYHYIWRRWPAISRKQNATTTVSGTDCTLGLTLHRGVVRRTPPPADDPDDCGTITVLIL
jgi:hypothetical protein